jgi:arsenite transporter
MLDETAHRCQVTLLAGALATGVLAGALAPGLTGPADAAIMPVLALLLYATFVQVPFDAIREATRDRRFLAASLAGNFVAVPLIVAGLLAVLPADPGLRAGVALVLLAPCTDWFVAFTHLGRGDAARATALTPLLFLAQLVALPVYLPLLTGLAPADPWAPGVLLALVAVVLVPFALAAATRAVLSTPGRAEVVTQRAERLTSPLLAVTLLLVATGQSALVLEAATDLTRTSMAFVAYAALALVLARVLARTARLEVSAARTLAFNLGTRNSFVVLPVALALPATYALAAPAVALQTLVELLALTVYLRLVQRWWAAQASRASGPSR